MGWGYSNIEGSISVASLHKDSFRISGSAWLGIRVRDS